MDLSKLSVRAASSKGAVLHLKDPATKEPLFDGDKPVTITVLGSEGDAVRAKFKDIESRRVKGDDVDNETAGAEMLAVLTAAWSGIALHSDEPLECNFDNAVKLYLDPDAEWIAEQVGPFSRNRRNYLGNRKTS